MVLHRNFNSVLVRAFRCEGALTRVKRGHVGDTGKGVTSRLYFYATPEANVVYYRRFYFGVLSYRTVRSSERNHSKSVKDLE